MPDVAKYWQEAYGDVVGTMNISLPDAMKAFVDEQVAERGYGTSSEYVRDLIRREQDRLQLRTLMLDGAAAPRTGEADAHYFDSLRARTQDKAAVPKQRSAARPRKA